MMKTTYTALLLFFMALPTACLSQARAQNVVEPEQEVAHSEVDAGPMEVSDGSAIEAGEGDTDDDGGERRDGSLSEQDSGVTAEAGVAEANDGEGEGEPLSLEVPDTLDLSDDEMWIFIDKSERRMVVNDGRGFREAYRVALGQNPEGHKRREGDGRTPEGEMYVCRRIVHNRFHRFLALSYPGPDDAQRGRRHRMLQPIEYRAIMRAHRNRTAPPWDTPLGGNLGIHGFGRRQDRARLHARGRDWTDGCIAVSNDEIERIYEHTRLGTRVVIVP